MKKKGIVIAIIVLLLAAGGAGSFYYIQNQKKENDRPHVPPEMEGREDIVTAAGTTSTGLEEKELEFTFLEADLIVDEVYVSSADEVEAGAKLLKITDNSLREATRELERAKMDASLAYRQGLIDYETGKLDAENILKKSQVDADFAQIIYDDTVAKAEVEVQKAEQEAEDAREIVEEYTDAIENDYYYTEYEVAEKEAAYEKNVALFFDKLDDYGYELDDDDDDDPNTFNIVREDGKDSGGSQDKDGALTVLQLLKSEYQENKEEYDQAVADYEAATEKAKAGIAEATDTLQLKELALEEARISLEKKTVSAQAEYDKTVIEAQKAQAAYETTLKSLSETLETLADEEEEAAENYELFMDTIGDGYIYADSAGTILMIRAMENTTLSKDGILLAYSDADTIEVTASVDQSDIAQIEIGETAAVVMEDYDTYTGVVTEINPMTSSSGRASVSYSVVLELQGDISQLSANITANVYFGITGGEYDEMRSRMQQEPGQGGPQAGSGQEPGGDAEEGGAGPGGGQEQGSGAGSGSGQEQGDDAGPGGGQEQGGAGSDSSAQLGGDGQTDKTAGQATNMQTGRGEEA